MLPLCAFFVILFSLPVASHLIGGLCAHKALDPCAPPRSRNDIRHIVMLSGPRHGSSFTMSLLADKRTLYLGELLESGAPHFMVHAPVVDMTAYMGALIILNERLPGTKFSDLGDKTGLAGNVSARAHLNASTMETMRLALEDLAISRGQDTILYKVFYFDSPRDTFKGSEMKFLQSVQRTRCSQFIIARRNFLQIEVSLLIAQETGHWWNRNSSAHAKTRIDLVNTKRSLWFALARDILFEEVSTGASGGVFSFSYEQVLEIEAKRKMSHLDAARAVRSFLVGGLAEAARTSVTPFELCAKENDDFLLGRLDLYMRQDNRDMLRDKVENYNELAMTWTSICLGVARRQKLQEPNRTCFETPWRLPA
mmetsp:Transcript_55068/g.125288  ORF Transcript_55068/g.125288 Transcript_55068/m.125288 type:complete len:367 (+) Transcript_55068:259-1359(+)